MRTNQATKHGHTAGERKRRGATTVFVAILSVVLVGMAAVAVDLARVNTAVNELQTSADAAALRAGLLIQADPDTNPYQITKSFVEGRYAPFLQERDNTPFTLSAGQIEKGCWDDDRGEFTVPPCTVAVPNINAVRVTTSKTSRLLFGTLVTEVNGRRGIGTQTPSRIATAWVANVTSVTCPAPWAFPLDAFNEALYGTTNDFTVRPTAYDSLMAMLRLPPAGPGPLSVTMIFYPANGTTVTGGYPFNAIDERDGGGTNMNDYADQIANPGVNCGANASSTINSTEFFPGQGTGAVPKKTVNGAFVGGPAAQLASMCEKPANNSRAVDCYPVGSSFSGPAGVDVAMSWVQPNGSSGTVKAIGGFRVMCVFGNTKGWGTSNGGGNGNGNNNNNNGNGNGGGPPETCDWYSQFRTSSYAPSGLPNELPEGTIVGYPVAPGPGLGTQVGNSPSLAKKLILVK